MGSMTVAVNGLALGDLTKEIKRTMRRSAKDAVQLGYMLRRVLEERLYQSAYMDFDTYLEEELQMDYTTANRFIGINKKYSVTGQSMEIAAEYEDYSQGLLIEMLNMTPEQEAKVTPDTTVKQAREIKRQDRPQKPAPEPMVPAVDMPEKKEVIIDGEFREIKEPEIIATSQSEEDAFPCDGCGYDDAGCCGYPGTKDDYCVLGDKRIPKDPESADEPGEQVSPYGCKRSEYPPNSLIATAGCGNKHDCFSCAQDCGIRAEKRYCVTAPMGNPFSCATMGLLKELRSKVGARCQFVNHNLAEHRAGDGEASPCCKECRVQDCGYRCGISATYTGTQDTEGAAEDYKGIGFARRILQEQQKLLQDYLDIGGFPEETVERQKIITGALAAMVCDLEDQEAQEQEEQEAQQPELPVLRNNEQRKDWLNNYKDWGLWYRDEHIDVNYYKYDFSDGSRLVVAEYPLRIGYWSGKGEDEHHFHLLEKNRKGYKVTYDEQYRDSTDSETYLVEFLKKLQQKGGKS